MAVVLIVAGVAWWFRGSGSGSGGNGGGGAADGASGPWQVYPGAFETQGGYRSGPTVLVAEPDGCYLGFGTDSGPVGVGPGTWRATGDCTEPASVTPSRRPVGDGLPSDDRAGVVAAAAAHGGGFLTVVRNRYFGDAYAYDSSVLRGNPSDGWDAIAEFRTDTPRASHIGPVALVAVERGYVAVGHREQHPVAWASRTGTSWREVALPLPSGHRGSVTGLVEGPKGQLVAVGTVGADGASHPAGWHSTDGGTTWRSVTMPDLDGGTRLTAVVHNGHQFLAFGAMDGNLGSAALALSSTDGLRWKVDDRLARAGARYIMAVAATADGTVYAVSADSKTNWRNREDTWCGTVWRLADGRWAAEALGCRGVPTTLVALPDGRIAGAHWETLFLRPSAAS
jgi:hypothetical protein